MFLSPLFGVDRWDSPLLSINQSINTMTNKKKLRNIHVVWFSNSECYLSLKLCPRSWLFGNWTKKERVFVDVYRSFFLCNFIREIYLLKNITNAFSNRAFCIERLLIDCKIIWVTRFQNLSTILFVDNPSSCVFVNQKSISDWKVRSFFPQHSFFIFR